MDSENIFLLLDQVVTVVVWVFGAAAIIVAILLFAQREKENLKLLIAELVCTIVVGICLLILPFLDAKLSHFQDVRIGKDETNLTSAHTEILGISNQLQQVASKYNEATNALVLAQAAAIEASNAVTNANIVVLKNLDRDISADKIATFTNALIGVPRGKFCVFFIENGETASFAQKIDNLLNKARFESVQPPSLMELFDGMPLKNLQLLVTSTNDPVFAGRIQRAFRKIGIPADGEIDPLKRAPGVLIIVVGEKE
jgi:hypothetical protein